MKYHTRTLALSAPFLLLATQLLVPPGGVQAAEGPAAKPNIVIMLVDQGNRILFLAETSEKVDEAVLIPARAQPLPPEAILGGTVLLQN
jgi:hypothetical protein